MKSKQPIWIIFVLILFLSVFLRLRGYSNLTDSVGAVDTLTYLQASEIDFPSWQFFTSIRSATLPLVYKILRPPGGYPPYLISSPAVTGSEKRLELLPGWDRVVIAQILTAILGWGVLAFVMFRRLANPVVKVLAVFLILLFGFAPQMADWDNVLISESLSFSLYALLIAGVIELAFSLGANAESPAWQIYAILSGLSLIVVFWVFIRDTNAYLVIFSLLALLILVILGLWRKLVPPGPLLLLTGLLLALLLFQQFTFRASPRWLLPFLNNLTANVFPYPARVDFFESKGMPTSPDLLNLRGSAEYNGIYDREEFIKWARQQGLSAYSEFLIRTPLWAASSVYEQIDFVFSENLQPYFQDRSSSQAPSAIKRPAWLLLVGNFLHSLSASAIVIDLVFSFILVVLAYRLRSSSSIVWASVAVWLVLGAMVLLVAGILGEVRSVLRHAMAGVVPLRLAQWLLLAILIDVLWTVPRLED